MSPVPLQGAGASAVSPLRSWGTPARGSSERERGYTRPERLWCTAHASGWVSQWLPYETCTLLGRGSGWGSVQECSCCQGGVGAPLGSSRGMGWQRSGSFIVPPRGQCRKLSEIRHDGGGGHIKFRGSVQKNAVMFARSLGLQKLPQRFHSLHPSRVWWGYSLLLQDFNPSVPGETEGKSPEQLDWSKQKPPTLPKTLSNF